MTRSRHALLTRRPDGDTVILGAESAVVTAVAAFGAVVSYTHIYTLARVHGQSELDARLLPLSVDGLILAASLVLLYEARKGRPLPKRAWFALGLGVAATLAANVLSGLPHGWLNAVISAWSPVAFVVAAELLMFMIHQARPETGSGTAAGKVPSSVFEAAKDRLKFAALHDFKITDRELADNFGLGRSDRAKVRTAALAETNGSDLVRAQGDA